MADRTPHDNPFIESALMRLEKLARAYSEEHANQTDTGSGDFLNWKGTLPLIAEDDDSLPETEELASFIWEDATPSQLIALVPIIDEMRDSLNRALRRAYNASAGKDMSEELPDLGKMREKLVQNFDAAITNIESGVFEGMTLDDILALPSVPPMGERKAKNSDEMNTVWGFVRAPKSPSDVKKPTNGGKNLRTNNKKVKLLVNGEIPTDYPISGELGDAMAKYLKMSVQDAARVFNNYRITENANLYTRESDGVVFGLTERPFTTKK